MITEFLEGYEEELKQISERERRFLKRTSFGLDSHSAFELSSFPRITVPLQFLSPTSRLISCMSRISPDISMLQPSLVPVPSSMACPKQVWFGTAKLPAKALNLIKDLH